MLENFACFLYENRLKTLIILFVFFAALCSQLPKLTINTTLESYLKKTDPVLQDFNYQLEQFGRNPLSICFAIKTKDIFDFDFLEKYKALCDEVCQNVPYVEKIETLINVKNIRSESEDLIIEDLFENWPRNQDELNILKERIRKNPIYRDTIISRDENFTSILVKLKVYSPSEEKNGLLDCDGGGFLQTSGDGKAIDSEPSKQYLTGKEQESAVNAAKALVSKYNSPDFRVYITGSITNSIFVQNAVMKDLQLFFLVSFTIISIFLYIIFRRISGVILPGLIVILSFLSTLGLRSLFGDPLTVVSQLMPCFIIAVGVGYSIHILAIFYKSLQVSSDKKESIINAFGHSGLPVLITCITTVGGLLSFLSAELVPVIKFGIYASTGVIFALLYTLLLIPPMISLFSFKIKIRKKQGHADGSWMEKFLTMNGRFVVGHPYLILATAFLVLIFSFIGIRKIHFGQDYVKWFPEGSMVRTATATIDNDFNGSYVTNVILDFKTKDRLYDPDILNRIEESLTYLENLKVGEVFVGKAWSITTILKEINQALHDNDKIYYTIPPDKNLVAQEFFLYESSDPGGLENFVDRSFSKAQLAIKIPNLDALYFEEFYEVVDRHLKNKFPEANITITSLHKVYTQSFTATIKTVARSYTTALFTVTLLMLIFLGPRYGLLSMIPNLFPIFFSLGLIGWLDFPLNISNLMVACIIIGLAVDDTIHFMHGHRKYNEKYEDVELSIQKTLQTTGRAIIVTTVVLTIGFLTFSLSTLNNFKQFGLLSAIAICLALISDLLIAPALLICMNKINIRQTQKVKVNYGLELEK